MDEKLSTNNNLIEAYFRRFLLKQEEDFWAFVEVEDLVFSEPETAWKLVLDMLALAPSEYMINVIAAGPLEDLLKLHEDKFRRRAQEQAAADSRFRHALSHVYVSDSLESEITGWLTQYGIEKLDFE